MENRNENSSETELHQPLTLDVCNVIIMHQSIPAVPIPPPGISRAFAHVLIPGVGHLKFYHCPGVGLLPTPRTTPGHLTR